MRFTSTRATRFFIVVYIIVLNYNIGSKVRNSCARCNEFESIKIGNFINKTPTELRGKEKKTKRELSRLKVNTIPNKLYSRV